MCGVPSTLLSGEVVRLSLEVHNVGHVPLNSLRLSSSLGPRLLLDTVGVASVNIFYRSIIIVLYFGIILKPLVKLLS